MERAPGHRAYRSTIRTSLRSGGVFVVSEHILCALPCVPLGYNGDLKGGVLGKPSQSWTRKMRINVLIK